MSDSLSAEELALLNLHRAEKAKKQNSPELSEMKDLLKAAVDKISAISEEVLSMKEKLTSLETAVQEKKGQDDSVEGLLRNREETILAMGGLINSVERRIEACEGFIMKKMEEQNVNIDEKLTSMDWFMETNSQATEKNIGEKLAGMKKFMEDNTNETGMILDTKLKLLGNTAKEMDKKLDAKLKLLENAANGLGGRLNGVKKEIIAAVAVVKKEVDVCGYVARGHRLSIPNNPYPKLTFTPDLGTIEEKRRKDAEDVVARGGCPNCFDYNPKKCAYGNGSGEHKGRRYCGSCSQNGGHECERRYNSNGREYCWRCENRRHKWY